MILEQGMPEHMSEARFTERINPDWCPNMQYWHALDREATEFEVSVLVSAFVHALQPEVVVETGPYIGQTSAAIGRALQGNGHGHLYSVELVPELAVSAGRAVEGLPVTVICDDSQTWLKRWDPPGPVEFAWIDSGPPAVRAGEVRLMVERGLFSPGAVAGIHDTGAQFSEVADPAWRPLEDEGLIKRITLRTPRGVSFAQILK